MQLKEVSICGWKGTLLWDKPYCVLKVSKKGKTINLSARSKAEINDMYYEVEFEDGCIMLIPEKLYLEQYQNQNEDSE